ncbi:MAG: zinc-ribbon domain-containing protein [Polyangiaceae bacterium]|nr:zinc-ribbon domain-containing protein [Polyangiaceae bacterium]
MRITCPACTAKYSIADEKVQNRLAKIRCRKCGTTIVIDGKASPPSVYAADAGAGAAAGGADYGGGAESSSQSAASPSGTEYTVDFGDNDQRTLTLEQIVDAYNSGEVVAETYVWTEGMTDWAQLGQIAEIVDALHAAAAAAEASVQAAATRPAAHEPSSPWSEHPGGGTPGARAAVSSARGQDLFRHYAAAGSEEEVTTSALHDMAPPVAATGARNESSVLFSLSALTASAGTSNLMSSPPTAIASSQDDSGLIDLRALTSAAERPSDSQAGMGHLGLGAPVAAAPLGLSAPLAMPASPNAAVLDMGLGHVEYPGRSNKTGLFIGGGIAVAAVVIALALILKPEPPRPVPTVDPRTLGVVPTAAPPPTVEQQPELTAKPPSTTSDEADAGAKKAAPKTAGGRWRPKPKAKGGGDQGSASPSPGSSPPAAPKPAASKGACGCAPGDLMCNMRCSAGK